MKMTVTFLDFSLVLVVLFILQFNQKQPNVKNSEINLTKLSWTPQFMAIVRESVAVRLAPPDCEVHHMCHDELILSSGDWSEKVKGCRIAGTELSTIPIYDLHGREVIKDKKDIESITDLRKSFSGDVSIADWNSNPPMITYIVRPIPGFYIEEWMSSGTKMVTIESSKYPERNFSKSGFATKAPRSPYLPGNYFAHYDSIGSTNRLKFSMREKQTSPERNQEIALEYMLSLIHI